MNSDQYDKMMERAEAKLERRRQAAVDAAQRRHDLIEKAMGQGNLKVGFTRVNSVEEAAKQHTADCYDELGRMMAESGAQIANEKDDE